MNQWFIRIFLGTERTGRGRRFGVGEGLKDESPARIWHKELWTCTKIRRARNWSSLISFLLSRGGCLPIFQNCPLLSNESVFWDTIEFKFHHMRPILRRRSLSFFLSPTQPNSSFFIPRIGFNRLQKWKWIIPPETLIGGFRPFTLKVWLISREFVRHWPSRNGIMFTIHKADMWKDTDSNGNKRWFQCELQNYQLG